MEELGVGIISSGCIADSHSAALSHFRVTSVRAVSSPGHAERFARRHPLPALDTDYRHVVERDDVDSAAPTICKSTSPAFGFSDPRITRGQRWTFSLR